jgi:hypothetical protein
MIKRNWLLAFREGNGSMATKVAHFLHQDFGWDVNFDDTLNCITYVENSYGAFDSSDQDDIENLTDQELIANLCSDLGMSSSRLQRIDNKFGTEISSLGKYTKLPLPKDIKKEVNNGNSIQVV